MKKAIIIGALKIDDISFILDEYKKGTFIACCDGGYLNLINQNITIDLFVGDFDTLDKKTKLNTKETIVLNPVKDDTDVFYTIKYLLNKGYNEFHIFGALGGKIDHTIGNIQILSYLCDFNCKGYLYSTDNQTVVHMIKNSCIRLKYQKTCTFSVFSYNEKSLGVTMKNFKYELDNYTLNNSVPIGVSNQFLDKEGYIEVKKGKLLLILPSRSIIDE